MELEKIKQELVETRKKYLDLMHRTGSVAFTQDKELKYTSVTNLPPGLNIKTVLGKTDIEISSLDEQDAKTLGQLKKKVLKDGKSRQQNVQTTIKGVVYHYDLIVHPLLDEQGHIIGIDCLSIDKTNYKKDKETLEVSTNRLKKAEEIAHLGYYEIDYLSNLYFWSEIRM